MTTVSELGARLVVSLERLDSGPAEFSTVADDAARAAIAARLGAPSVSRFEGAARLEKSGALVTVTGRVRAEMERLCVVSLEPVSETIDEEFETLLTTDPEPETDDELEFDPDEPEPIDGDAIDVGDLIIQYAALAMEPHPRRADAAFEDIETPPEALSPFSVLKDRS